MSLDEYKQDIYHCCKCGMCRTGYGTFMPTCPSGEQFGFNSYYAEGRLDIAMGLLENTIMWSDRVAHRIFTCTDCMACQKNCYDQTSMKPLDVIRELRRELIERGLAPPKLRDFLENISKFGNPYGVMQKNRGKWAQDTEIKLYSGEEFLYYVGCVGSFDEIGQRIARSLGDVLVTAKCSFGILGNDENCSGNEPYRLGEIGLFEILAEKNIKIFKGLGVKRVVTLDPHAYNIMKNEYMELNGTLKVMHYTQLVRDFIESGKLDISKGFKAKVTYHDPCFLGRHNDEYEAPRKILNSIPGIEFVEMERNKANSFCCGGGGSNFYTDLLGSGENAANRIRIREAYETGAEILAVACPICAKMLEDGLQAENLQEKLKIKDISEIVKDACSFQ